MREAPSDSNSNSNPYSKAPVVTESSLPRGLEGILPPPADDSAVRHKITTLYEQIGLHLENYYHKSPVSIPPGAEKELAAFNSPHLTLPLSQLLSQTRAPSPILKHVLTRLILDRTAISSDPALSVLPNELVSFHHTLQAVAISKQKKPNQAEFVSLHRTISSYLLPPTTWSSHQPYLRARDVAINDTIASFSRAFNPWINNRFSDNDRVSNLTEIMKSAAEVGIWLAGEPCAFEFVWGGEGSSGKNEVVTAPRVVKVGDERGNLLRQGLEIVPKSTGRT
jgi:hypothetical protein